MKPTSGRLLGLFHFNVQYVAGDMAGYHRYCLEAIAPFLSVVERNPKWRVTMEIAGSGLEFLAQHYPMLLERIRVLIGSQQLEMISSTYAPTLWVAFPKRDLIKSIELNRDCLRRLDIPISRVFFAQEAFFGVGLGEITEYFDAAVCKSDYLSYFVPSTPAHQAYRLEGLKVLVGSSHILNSIDSVHIGGNHASSFEYLYQHRLQTARSELATVRSAHLDGEDWLWYHLGSGHHITTPASPGDWNRFFSEREWTHVTESLIRRYLDEGYTFGTLAEYAQSLKLEYLPDLPSVIEGSWNSERSNGVFTWMGKQLNSWEDDSNILGLSWRARERLVELERTVGESPDMTLDDQLREEIANLWTLQLMAESSDSLGWSPTPGESSFAPGCAEEVLRSAFHLRDRLPRCQIATSTETRVGGTKADFTIAPLPPSRLYCDAELVGAEGCIGALQLSDSLQVVDVSFDVSKLISGVRFSCFPTRLVYCPSGRESRPIHLDWCSLRPPTIYVPLSNGLVELADRLYLIRHNLYGQVAACFNRCERSVSFITEGGVISRHYRWRFYLHRGDLDDALGFANALNRV